MGMQTVVLKVGMSCGGCVGAVKRVLGKMEGLFHKKQSRFEICNSRFQNNLLILL